MTEAQKKFVETLRELIRFDALTSEWLMPLEPLLNVSYERRFCFGGQLQNYVYYMVYTDMNEQWLTPEEFYQRSRLIAENLLSRGWLNESSIVPTGGVSPVLEYDTAA